MGNCDVKIEINRATSGGTFTNYDVLSGTVTLTVTGSISLNYIQVKLEGISKTELSIPREPNGKKDRKDRILNDIHKVLYDTMIVFPPENVRNVSKAKEFTLSPGNYTYPFHFKIPLNNSCVKLLGITNKVQFNKKTLDLRINNGNLNSDSLRNMTNLYISNFQNSLNGNPGATPSQSQPVTQNYHITNQLPPSLSGLSDFASIKYFVKVTCKRSSFLKVNLRAFDPFIFLPLDLDSHNEPLFNSGDFEEYREVFVRKELAFKNRIPDIVGMKMASPDKSLPKTPGYFPTNQKKGFLSKFFDTSAPYGHPSSGPNVPKKSRSNSYPQVNDTDVPFAFEARFRHPEFLIPTKSPSFKLYLVSKMNPSIYSLAEYGKPEETNGLGAVFLQRLVVELTSTTIISVLENDGSSNEVHKSRHDDVITICNNSYQNLRFDLMNCKKLKSSSSTSSSNSLGDLFELEIPKKYYSNCVLPDYLSPSFRTCNIQRKYKLSVVGGFSSERISDINNQAELTKKLRYVDLQVNDIKVLGGLSMTSSLQDNASKLSLTGKSNTNISINSGQSNGSPAPVLPTRPDEKSNGTDYDKPPKLPNKNSYNDGSGRQDSIASSADSLPLPTYDDVMRESTYQNNSEHIRARRRYQQHEHYYNNLEG